MPRRPLLIDPGHGGADPGAVAHDLVESEINLEVSLQLAEALADAGVPAVLTRYTDRPLTLPERVALERLHRPELYLSVHCNAADAPAARGPEVWTSRGETRADRAATLLGEALGQLRGTAPLRTDYSDGDLDREAGFYVLKHTRAPAVLVELGFLTNKRDAALLRAETYRAMVAQVLANGVRRWLQETSGWTGEPSVANS